MIGMLILSKGGADGADVVLLLVVLVELVVLGDGGEKRVVNKHSERLAE